MDEEKRLILLGLGTATMVGLSIYYFSTSSNKEKKKNDDGNTKDINLVRGVPLIQSYLSKINIFSPNDKPIEKIQKDPHHL